jgi:DNA polymerase V
MGVPLSDQGHRRAASGQVLSSNYALYAEMSRRFMKMLSDFVSPKEQEIYSIDECFLDLTAHSEITT